MTTKEPFYYRFSIFQRVEHWLLTLSFTTLAVTGLPQRYPLAGWSDTVLQAFGGLESARLVHRWAAILMIVMFFVHVCELAYKSLVLRLAPSMLPGLKDATDLFQMMAYNAGLTQKRPDLPRYSFAEKMEYWALIWGTVIMALTGFMLWNPITTARYLPGQVLPAAKVAHSAEALLAVLAIIVWHFYGVHLKSFNWSMITGKLTRHQMIEEHNGELLASRTQKREAVPADVRRRRTRLFAPAVALAGVALAGVLYLFTSYEETATATIPPAETVPAIVLATTTPTPRPSPTTPSIAPAATSSITPTATAGGAAPQIPHTLEGRENCAQCHGASGPLPFPSNHANYPSTSCLTCHQPAAGTAALTTTATVTTTQPGVGSPSPVPSSATATALLAGTPITMTGTVPLTGAPIITLTVNVPVTAPVTLMARVSVIAFPTTATVTVTLTTDASTAGEPAAPSGVAAQACMGCHAHQQVFQKTADYTTFEGYEINPHVTVDPIEKSPTMASPHASGQNVVDCLKCHQPHSLPQPAAGEIKEPPIDYCYTCHHTATFQPCSKCH